MNPGELNCRITLLKETKVPDEQGGFETTYTVRATVWAKLMTVTTKTIDQFEQLTPEILHRITIRYRSDVAVTDRVQYGDRIFEQIGPPINEEEKKAYLRLECREVVADAAND
ncbi:Phage head-tail joining protein [Sporomusa ovata DSM 2662]|uniref:Phage head-tail adaptor n=1 Tax=Sporomusa ovata TaxID=2378 RepID=A0A0U1L6C2_9FIRM|nr:phage head closure protein [Sporomusa ovata]EQB24616.1 phage head-tail adaptor, putative, SPP1 family [Sporomusa ovata DSM 2662]EQB24720.1 phage head-tail adaptor SPP1 family [Sporomusa ovata DSM 2662]CQR75065.1 hypothetical protein SpAn4DRAFT_4429 [Sporomusa ovata]